MIDLKKIKEMCEEHIDIPVVEVTDLIEEVEHLKDVLYHYEQCIKPGRTSNQ